MHDAHTHIHAALPLAPAVANEPVALAGVRGILVVALHHHSVCAVNAGIEGALMLS
jgi:hypothetical protein